MAPSHSIILDRPLRLGLLALLFLHLGAWPTTAQERARPVFKNGEAQVVEAFKDRKRWIVHDLWVETTFDSDGDGKKDRMHVSVTRPEQTETEGLRLPVVYETSPYFSGVGSTAKQFFWDPEQELGENSPPREDPPEIRQRSKRPRISRSQTRTWIPRGYAVVHSCSPGTGLSQGCPTVGGKNESLAPKAVIDWLNGRAKGYTEPTGGEEVKAFWCTGKVGMIGTSYNGTLPIAAATTGVDGLEAIIPIAPNTSYYHYYRSNGLVRHPGGYMGEDIDVLYDFISSGSMERREWCKCNIRDEILKKNQDRKTGDYSEWWAARDYLNQLGPVKAATLMAHAFNDWNVMPEHSVRILLALKKKGVPTQAYFHQSGHGGPPPLKQMNRWFTRYLHGVKNGVEKDPKSWVVREGAPRLKPTAYPDYPHPEAAPVRLHLLAGGASLGTLSLQAGEAQGTEGLVDDVALSGAELAKAETSEHRLIYATPELTKPVHFSGTSRLKIRVAANRPAANLSVWMVSLPWTPRSPINANIITRGWADPQNHESLSKSAPLEPGRFYDLEFDLQPDDQIIPVGQRIGLMIFSSDRDFTLWPPAGTGITVDLDHTSITMPVVGGKKALSKALGEGR